jgi:hypothetical protein
MEKNLPSEHKEENKTDQLEAFDRMANSLAQEFASYRQPDFVSNDKPGFSAADVLNSTPDSISANIEKIEKIGAQHVVAIFLKEPKGLRGDERVADIRQAEKELETTMKDISGKYGMHTIFTEGVTAEVESDYNYLNKEDYKKAASYVGADLLGAKSMIETLRKSDNEIITWYQKQVNPAGRNAMHIEPVEKIKKHLVESIERKLGRVRKGLGELNGFKKLWDPQKDRNAAMRLMEKKTIRIKGAVTQEENAQAKAAHEKFLTIGFENSDKSSQKEIDEIWSNREDTLFEKINSYLKTEKGVGMVTGVQWTPGHDWESALERYNLRHPEMPLSLLVVTPKNLERFLEESENMPKNTSEGIKDNTISNLSFEDLTPGDFITITTESGSEYSFWFGVTEGKRFLSPGDEKTRKKFKPTVLRDGTEYLPIHESDMMIKKGEPFEFGFNMQTSPIKTIKLSKAL